MILQQYVQGQPLDFSNGNKIKEELYYQYLAKQEQFPFKVVVIIKLPYGGRVCGVDIEV